MPKVSFDCTDAEYDKVVKEAKKNERSVAQQMRYMIRNCDQ